MVDFWMVTLGDFGKWSWFVWVTAVEIFNEIIGGELSGGNQANSSSVPS